MASLGDKELLSTRSAEIKACFNSSQSGQRLYLCAMRALVEEELATVIRDRLKEPEASKTPITQYVVAEWQRITVGNIEAISGLASISGRYLPLRLPWLHHQVALQVTCSRGRDGSLVLLEAF